MESLDELEVFASGGQVVEKEKAHGIQKVSYTHDAMIDLILANPKISQGEMAKHFGFSQGWVSRVIGSDAFQARLAERKVQLVDPEIKANFDDRLKGLALQSLDVIQRKLDATGNPDLAVKALDLTTKALGLGARPQNIAQQNNYVVALPPKIVNEGQWAEEAKAHVLEHRPVSSGPVIEDVVPVQKVI